MQWLTVFCLSWRAHLVGSRRVWHPHHYFSVFGYRAGQLVARPSFQITNLSRSLGLLESLFSRGARIWSFGINSFFSQAEWGISWPEWMPGQLTNSVFQRHKRNYFIKQGALYNSKRRLKRFKRRFNANDRFAGIDMEVKSKRYLFSFRRNALRGGPLKFNPLYYYKVVSLVTEKKALRASLVNLVRPPLDDSDRPGRLTLNRQKIKINLVKNIFKKLWIRQLRPTVSLGLSSFDTPKLIKRARLISRQKVIVQNRHRALQSLRSFRESSNYQTIPFQFPATIVAVGLGSNRSLLSEANTLGVPVVYFQNSGISPNLSPFTVIWGTESSRSRGIYYLIEQAFYRVWTNSFLNTVWARLV